MTEPIAPGDAKKAVATVAADWDSTRRSTRVDPAALRTLARHLRDETLVPSVRCTIFERALPDVLAMLDATVAADLSSARAEDTTKTEEGRFDTRIARTLAITVREAAGGDEPDPDNGHPHYTCRLCRAEFVVLFEREPTELCYACAWESLGTLSAALLSACDETEALRGELIQARAQAVKDCVMWLSVADESPATARRMAEDVLAGVAPVPPPGYGEPPW